MQSTGTIRRSWRSAAMALRACCAVPGRRTPSLMAQVSSYGDKQMGQTNDRPPALLDGVGIAQRLNQQLPLNLTFTDDAGQQVALGNYFGKRPAILALVYYRCPMLCSEELDGLTSALQMVKYVPGKDFNIDRRQHRSHRRHRSGRCQEARIPEALRPSGNRQWLALHDRHAAEYRCAHAGRGLPVRQAAKCPAATRCSLRMPAQFRL